MSVDEYIESQPEYARKTLSALRTSILKAAPGATELINYDMPAYALVKGRKRDKQTMIAGYKTFAGFYPGAAVPERFSNELPGFKVGKASVQFPCNHPLPERLIVEIIEYKKKRIASAAISRQPLTPLS